MGKIMLSGCAMNDRITQDAVECDLFAPGATKTHCIVYSLDLVWINDVYLIYLQKKQKQG